MPWAVLRVMLGEGWLEGIGLHDDDKSLQDNPLSHSISARYPCMLLSLDDPFGFKVWIGGWEV